MVSPITNQQLLDLLAKHRRCLEINQSTLGIYEPQNEADEPSFNSEEGQHLNEIRGEVATAKLIVTLIGELLYYRGVTT